MTLMVFYALAAGMLVAVSRGVNGRLALATSPLVASFWNHLVGLLVLIAVGLAGAGLWPERVSAVPVWAWAGGSLGVVFVASGSWLVARIGAVLTAMLVIAGQMISGVLLDILRDAPGSGWARAAGVVLILAGMVVAQSRK
ncbi:DMT family transporter [Frigidibacter sp. ROC022]|uniref:DMT family transporter n=1 Tax=Frigidibacter sp. ROC022 TaxID=2971796 RepID=UPI00215ACE14|nr:DMT family transporter [Frigidibacter sp. ROC022]MCR8722675.1 DMT family transporter [Frigidibacter sp. ROC022]